MATSSRKPSPQVREIGRESLTTKVYDELRAGLMEGRFWPGYRFKIRDLAAAMNVSETPCREALMQLVRERVLDMDAGRSIAAAPLTLAQYLELRTIRMQLEGMAGEAAALNITPAQLRRLAELHKALIKAQDDRDWPAAVRINWQFHHGVYSAARMPELLALIEGIWLRNGPMLNLQYPDAAPTYDGEHQHLAVMEGLRQRNPAKVRTAIQNDTIEGGRAFVKLLERIDRGEATYPQHEAAPATVAARQRSARAAAGRTTAARTPPARKSAPRKQPAAQRR
jgi:DNA-binding GntR family transcriptional regulator